MKRYPVHYSAFDGRDLSPKGYMELNPDTAYCDLLISTTDITSSDPIRMYPNPASNAITIERSSNEIISFAIINLAGITIESGSLHAMKSEILVSELESGLYTLLLEGQTPLRFAVIK